MANAINRGQRLGATLVNKMAQAAMGAGQLRIGAGRGSGGPLGSSAVNPQLNTPDDNVIACVATHTQNVFTVVEVELAYDMDQANPIARCGLVERSGASKLGVLLDNAVPDRIVPVRIEGTGLVKYSNGDIPDLAPGDRLAGIKHTGYPVKCHGGPLLVIAVAIHDVAWGDINFALVHVNRNRLGSVYVRDCYSPPLVDGPCDVLIVDVGFAVTNPQPGVVLIT